MGQWGAEGTWKDDLSLADQSVWVDPPSLLARAGCSQILQQTYIGMPLQLGLIKTALEGHV